MRSALRVKVMMDEQVIPASECVKVPAIVERTILTTGLPIKCCEHCRLGIIY
jgi:hypothetical protein